MKAPRLFAVGLLCCVAALVSAAEDVSDREIRLQDLGRALYFDVNLSLNRSQSCATCHDPAVAFTDWRDNGVGAAASLGDDMFSLGDRQAPTAGYAALTPEFHQQHDGVYVGGQFWDGRAAGLAEQAMGPPLNPLEMAMPDQQAVLQRLKENTNYLRAFPKLFGAAVLEDAEQAYTAMAESIAAFERSEFFSPFDSRYDRYLRDEYQPTEQEELGMTLFFSNQFTNCNQCHQLKSLPESTGETFSNYQYENIGVPVNRRLRAANGLGEQHIDRGLLENPEVNDVAMAGRFKVPTLRNVALTGPYMHNGVFADLETVLRFYNKYLTRSSKARINPETGELWGAPEVADNIAMEKLEAGRVLDDKAINALLAFMEMLTDKRFEPVLEARQRNALPAVPE